MPAQTWFLHARTLPSRSLNRPKSVLLSPGLCSYYFPCSLHLDPLIISSLFLVPGPRQYCPTSAPQLPVPGSCHQCTPEVSWIACAQLRCFSSRYLHAQASYEDQGLWTWRYLQDHLLLPPDQEACRQTISLMLICPLILTHKHLPGLPIPRQNSTHSHCSLTWSQLFSLLSIPACPSQSPHLATAALHLCEHFTTSLVPVRLQTRNCMQTSNFSFVSPAVCISIQEVQKHPSCADFSEKMWELCP